MEARYLSKHCEVVISEALDLEKYFNEYGAQVFGIGTAKRDTEALAKLIGTTEEDVRKLESICNWKQLLPQVPDDVQVPYDGFKPNFSHHVPECGNTLASIRALQMRSDDDTKKVSKNLFRYRGEVNLEDAVRVESEMKDLAPLHHFLLTVRVYLPGIHVKSSSSSRSTYPQVSQEFICVSSDQLIHLRDRILCSADYQPMTGDVSDNPFDKTTAVTKDVNTAALFYLGNNFYIDSRNQENEDYSQFVREWGTSNGYMLGNVFRMEETTWCEVKELRLGYPYLYMHQRFCEHLIIVTDVRLLHDSDCMDSTKYPIMRSFANLQGKYCSACRKKASKYLVVNNNRLPLKVTHFCTICLTLFNYVHKIKTGSFHVYKYVDRASLI